MVELILLRSISRSLCTLVTLMFPRQPSVIEVGNFKSTIPFTDFLYVLLTVPIHFFKLTAPMT